MRTYKAFVRPARLMECEVFKDGLTAAEIMLLRLIHGGDDAVVKIEITGMDKRPHKDEYQRLVDKYKGAVKGDPPVHLMTTLFGPGHFNVKLPVDLPGFEEPADPGLADDYAAQEAAVLQGSRKAA